MTSLRRNVVSVAVLLCFAAALLPLPALAIVPPLGGGGSGSGSAPPSGGAPAPGTVLAWGWDYLGQLGDGGDPSNQSTPVAVSGLQANTGVVAVSSNGHHTLALNSDGSVLAWGSDANGQLGDGGINDHQTAPVAVSGLGAGSGVVAVSAGETHSLAVRSDGSVLAWGGDAYGQLGDGGADTDHSTPVAVSGLGAGSGVIAVAAAGYHSLALRSDGSVLAWGRNDAGQLGTGGSAANQSSPVAVSALGTGSGVVALAAGWHHSLALRSDGSVLAWGHDSSGALGVEVTAGSQPMPVAVSGLGAGSGVVAVAASAYNSLALRSDGSVLAWGADDAGQLGDGGANVKQFTPVAVSGLGAGSGVIAVNAGYYHSIALRKDGSVLAWGADHEGQLGDGGANVDQTTPVAVSGLGAGSGVTAVAAGGYHSLAIKASGSGTTNTSQLSLSPTNGTAPAGGRHTVTAQLLDATGSKPVAGAPISFAVIDGPDKGIAGTCNSVCIDPSGTGSCSSVLGCATDAAGRVSWTFTNSGTAGVDTIRAFLDDNGNGLADAGEPAAWAGMTWTRGSVVEAVPNWSMTQRTMDVNGDGIIDKYIDGNRTADVPADGRYPVILDGCRSTGDIGRYSWMIGTTEIANSSQCQSTALLPEGIATVKLTVTGQAGTHTAQLQMNVVDHLIVSLGDSFASGEGNPDVTGDYDCGVDLGVDLRTTPQGMRPVVRFDKIDCTAKPGREAVWKDEQCHRSAKAGPALAALALEQADDHSSVTFIHLACSGATVMDGLLGAQGKEGDDPPPQVSKARDLVNGQKVDAMTLSIGGNDVYFAKIIEACITKKNCPTDKVDFGDSKSAKGQLHDVVQTALGALPAKHALVNMCLRNATCSVDGKQVKSVLVNSGTPVLVTDYPNITRGRDGSYCSDAGAMTPGEYEWADKVVLTGQAGTTFRMHAYEEKDTDLKVSHDGLNTQVDDLERLSWWPISTYESFYERGYCADEGPEGSWVRSITQSLKQQGDHNGGFHPNERGHQKIKELLLIPLKAALGV